MTFSHLLMVTDNALKLDYGSAIFVNFVSQINETLTLFLSSQQFMSARSMVFIFYENCTIMHAMCASLQHYHFTM